MTFTKVLRVRQANRKPSTTLPALRLLQMLDLHERGGVRIGVDHVGGFRANARFRGRLREREYPAPNGFAVYEKSFGAAVTVILAFSRHVIYGKVSAIGSEPGDRLLAATPIDATANDRVW